MKKLVLTTTLLGLAGLGVTTHPLPADAARCVASTKCLSASGRRDGSIWRVTIRNRCRYPVKSRVCFQRRGRSGYGNCKANFNIGPGGRWTPWATYKRHTGRYTYSALNTGCRQRLR